MGANRLTVAEENRLISQIQQLKSRRPLVGKYADMENDAENNSAASIGTFPAKTVPFPFLIYSSSSQH